MDENRIRTAPDIILPTISRLKTGCNSKITTQVSLTMIGIGQVLACGRKEASDYTYFEIMIALNKNENLLRYRLLKPVAARFGFEKVEKNASTHDCTERVKMLQNLVFGNLDGQNCQFEFCDQVYLLS